MKIRNGFVSNSSSSSFVIAIKKGEKCPHCGRTDVDFLDLVEQIGAKADFEDTELKRSGAQEIWNRWESDIFQYSDAEEKRRFEQVFNVMTDAERKGYRVGEIEISYHDSGTTNLMKDLEARNALIVLWADHGGIDLDKIKL